MAASHITAGRTMKTLTSHPDLPLAVTRLAASVVGLSTRRYRGSGVLWRAGVVVGSASALWPSLAAVTLSGASLPVAERAPVATLRVGDFVFAVSREPSGLTQASFGQVGMVGGERRTWGGGRVETLIRLDGGLYPGLAGAPVADATGQALGVASSTFSRHHGVVLPVATVDRVLDQLLAHGRVQQGYLGIAAQPARTVLDGVAATGLLVSSLAEDGPAARGGLLVGDVIVKLCGSSAHNGPHGSIHRTLFDTRRCLPRRSASLAATKWSFDVARPIAIAVRAIANDPSGEAEQTSWPR
jgi:S1-C subfamily serine protease